MSLIKTANTFPWDQYITWNYSNPKLTSYLNASPFYRAQLDRHKYIRGQYEQEPQRYKVNHYLSEMLFKITNEANPPQEGDVSSDRKLIVNYVYYSNHGEPVYDVYWKSNA